MPFSRPATAVVSPWNILFGLLGMTGALLLFAGDMLFYGHFGSGAEFRAGLLATVTQADLWRLYAGGLVGPPVSVVVRPRP